MSKLVVDIGSCYTKILILNKDVVLYEPTIIAVENNNFKHAKVGKDAVCLIGKTSDDIKFIRPIKNGQVDSEKALYFMLYHFMKKINVKGRFNSALIVTNIGTSRTDIKKIESVFNTLKIFNTSFIEAPILSLLKINPTIKQNKSAMIVDLGGGQTTVACLSINGIISGVSAEFGGNTLNELIIAHLEKTIGITLTLKQAEELKESISGLAEEDGTKCAIVGKDVLTGRTKTTIISNMEIYEPMVEYTNKVIDLIKVVLNKLPQESVLDIAKNGIHLTGGGNNIYNIEDYFLLRLDIKSTCVEEGDLLNILGGAIALKNKKLLNKIKLNIF